MSSSRTVPQGLWAVLTAVFAVLTLIFLVKGTFLMALVALGFAIWTGIEASGHGAFAERGKPSSSS